MDIITRIIDHSHKHDASSPAGRTLRIAKILPEVLADYPGHVLEIGCGKGDTTKVMLPIAAQVGKSVLAVDPWELSPDQPPGYGVYSYTDFIQATHMHNNLVVCRQPSTSEGVTQFMEKLGAFAFAFVDGLQYMNNVLHDLDLCHLADIPVICVDDYNRSTGISQVPAAIKRFMQIQNDYRLVDTRKNNIECYLVHKHAL